MKSKLIYLLMLLIFLVPTAATAAEDLVVVDIQGMTCNLCPIAIKKSLSGVEGVTRVKISFKEKKGWLTVDEKVSDQQILDAIAKPGAYKGKIMEREPDSQ